MNYNLSFCLFPFKKQPQNGKNYDYESPKNNTERVEWFFQQIHFLFYHKPIPLNFNSLYHGIREYRQEHEISRKFHILLVSFPSIKLFCSRPCPLFQS